MNVSFDLTNAADRKTARTLAELLVADPALKELRVTHEYSDGNHGATLLLARYKRGWRGVKESYRGCQLLGYIDELEEVQYNNEGVVKVLRTGSWRW